jgi:hypothetical protein
VCNQRAAAWMGFGILASAWGVEIRSSGSGYWVLGIGYWVLGIGY